MELIDTIHELKALQVSAEYKHWITSSEPIHRTLEKLYTELRNDIDHLVECSLGSGIIHIGAFYTKTLTINLDDSIQSQIIALGPLLRRTAEVLEKDGEIQDIIFDIMNTLNKINYLLSLS